MVVRAGGKVRAGDVPAGTWQPYTPVWSASTPPSLGNGSIAGRYCQVGKLVVFQGRLITGSTTTYGSGAYTISLPVAAYDAFGGNGIIGTIWFRDASGADHQGQLINGGSAFSVRPAGATYGASAAWTPSTPFTLATTDWVSWHGSYEAA